MEPKHKLSLSTQITEETSSVSARATPLRVVRRLKPQPAALAPDAANQIKDLTHRLAAAQLEIKAMQFKLHNVLNAINLPIVRWSVDGLLLDCNEPYERFVGKPLKDMLGKPVNELFDEDVCALVSPYFARALRGEKCSYSRYVAHVSRPQWIRVNLVPDSGEHGQSAEAIYAITVDIDEEKRAIDSLKESQRRLDVFTENIPSIMGYFDDQLIVRFASKSFLHHLNKPSHEVLGQTIAAVFGDEAWQELEPYTKRALAGESVEFERHEMTVKGERIWHRVQYVPDFSPEGTIKGVYSSRMDITDIKLAEAALKRDADWDVLTQTFNRNYFNHALSQALALSPNAPFSLLYLDLDGFKQVNDTLGHSMGDELLAHIAQSLKTTISPKDILSRIGGDEFAVLSFGHTAANCTLADRLLLAASKPYRMGDFKLSLTMSIGIVFVTHDKHIDVRRLLQKADAAMYEAKRSGKNRWVIAT
jgi:diguanylate cyclase (GGDEF)-like protein/PAS domain S-box-containing protein